MLQFASFGSRLTQAALAYEGGRWPRRARATGRQEPLPNQRLRRPLSRRDGECEAGALAPCMPWHRPSPRTVRPRKSPPPPPLRAMQASLSAPLAYRLPCAMQVNEKPAAAPGDTAQSVPLENTMLCDGAHARSPCDAPAIITSRNVVTVCNTSAADWFISDNSEKVHF